MPSERGTRSILIIWAAATAPMALLAWRVAPLLVEAGDPLGGITFWWALVAGMAWQGVLSLIVLAGEGMPASLSALKDRLWLGAPVWRQTGKRAMWAFMLVPVFVVLGFAGDDLVTSWFDGTAAGRMLHHLAPAYARIETLAVPEAKGEWRVLWVALVSSLFNYLFGEALLFHGILLPRMEKAWGRWAWLGNGILFAAYHVHKFWVMPGLVPSCLAYSLPAQMFRSAWLAVLIHGVEGIILVMIVLRVIRQGSL